MSRLAKDSSFPSTASTSQEDLENGSSSTSSRKLRVTLLSSEWKSTKGGLSTINRELAIQLAKHPNVEVSVYLPQCSEEDKRVAESLNVNLIEAKELIGFDPLDWLLSVPENHCMDCVIGHGLPLGPQVQLIQRQCCCKWILVIHTSPEELGKYKSYAEAISKGEKKHLAEIRLCELADQVVAVGPKLTDAYSRYLRHCPDQAVLTLTPGIFSEFADVKQASKELGTFSVLVFGRGDNEDFELKGYDIAAKAIAELNDNSYHLMFVGAKRGKEDKIAKKLYQQGIARKQLTVRCFMESRGQLAQLLCEVDLAIMPSRTEGFGLAALEALSAGLPVLVSANSGLGEALKKVLYGSSCVVDSEDPKEWAKAIRAVRQKDRKIRLEESKVLCGEYAKKYSWQGLCDRLVERMMTMCLGNNADAQDLSLKAPVICQASGDPLHSGRFHKAIKVPGKKSTLPKKRENADRGMPKSKTLKVPAKNSAPKNKCKTRKKTAKENGDCAMPKSKSSYLSDMESDDCNDDSATTHALKVPGKKPNPPKKRVSRKIPDKENEDQGKRKTKMPWTEEEKGAVYKHLSSFVRQGRFPGKRDCENCILKSNGALERRDWLAVKYFVKNQVDKRKRVLAPKNN